MTDIGLKSLKDVYFMLEDNHSREVFLNRLQYLVTGEKEYFRKMPEQERFNDSTLSNSPVIPPDLVDKLNSTPGKELVIYGTGVIGKTIYSALLQNGLDISCFWDRNPVRQANGSCGKKVFAPAPTGNEKIIIGSKDYEEEMIQYLLSLGAEKEKIIIFEYIINHMDLENQYFAADIIKFSDDEVFIDAGAFDLDNSERLLKKCNSVKKIYAFDPNEIPFYMIDEKIMKHGFNNLEIIKVGLWSETKNLTYIPFGSSSRIADNGSVTVKVVALDEAVNDKVTFIKMDIEGAELEALKGAEKTIKRYKPKLAISVYHKSEDIIDIPLYIKNLVQEYRIYMRHYTDYEGETVLYAVV